MDIDDKGQPKGIRIHLNGREKVLTDDSISFEDLVLLAYPKGTEFDQPGYRVVFSNAVRPQYGDLKAGEVLKAKDGTVINVTPFDLS